MPAQLQTPFSAIRTGANLLARALKLGSAVLGGLASVVEGVAQSEPSELRDAPADAAIATPLGIVDAPEGVVVAPEGFIADAERHGAGPGVEDVVPAPRAAEDAGGSEAPPAEFAPSHVDAEAVIVAEFSDPGAENGAGAQVRIEEPWQGYRLLKAPEVIDRLVAEPNDVLVLVLLYERAHRARRTVIAAAERELARRAA